MNREDALKQSQAALDELAEALAQGKSEQLMVYLEFLSRFHQYSFNNCLLIVVQRPDATHVAGFQRWKSLGRHVKKGEKGILILAPIVRRRRAPDADVSLDDETSARVCGFRAAYIFDVAQTEGDALPEFSHVSGDPGHRLKLLQAAVQRRGIELVYEASLGGADGRSEGGKIALRSGMVAAEEFAVMVHEFAHELLHRGERRKETTRQIRELEAEAVAFVVCRSVGLDAKERSNDYIQLYSGDKERLLASLDQIQRTAAEIIEAVSLPVNDESQIAA